MSVHSFRRALRASLACSRSHHMWNPLSPRGILRDLMDHSHILDETQNVQLSDYLTCQWKIADWFGYDWFPDPQKGFEFQPVFVMVTHQYVCLRLVAEPDGGSKLFMKLTPGSSIGMVVQMGTQGLRLVT